MAEISDYTISQDAKFYPDYAFNTTALGEADVAITSSVFKFGKDQSGTELWIKADAAITVAATETLTIKLLQSVDSAFTSTVTETLVVLPAATYAAGSDLIRFVSTKETLQYCKLELTATEDLSAKTVTGNLRYISR
jgi:hypothetical protein